MANNSAAKIAANKRYTQKNYERLQAYVKPQVVQSVREYTAARGESIAAFLTRSVYGQMERDGGGVVDMPQAGGGSENAQAWHEFLGGIKAVDEPLGEDFDRVMGERVTITRELAL